MRELEQLVGLVLHVLQQLTTREALPLVVVLSSPLILIALFVIMLIRDQFREPEPDWRDIKAPPAPELPPTLEAPPDAEAPLDPEAPLDSESAEGPSGNDRAVSPAGVSRRPVILPAPFALEKAAAALLVFLMIFGFPANLGIGLLVAVGAFWAIRSARQTARLTSQGKTTVGTIVDLTADDDGDVSDFDGIFTSGLRPQPKARVTYRFRVPEEPGVEVEGTYVVPETDRLAMWIGEEVTVRYLPEDPHQSTLELDSS